MPRSYELVMNVLCFAAAAIDSLSVLAHKSKDRGGHAAGRITPWSSREYLNVILISREPCRDAAGTFDNSLRHPVHYFKFSASFLDHIEHLLL